MNVSNFVYSFEKSSSSLAIKLDEYPFDERYDECIKKLMDLGCLDINQLNQDEMRNMADIA